jgi:hypothetical protein
MAGPTFGVWAVGVVGVLRALLICLLFVEMLETAAAVGKRNKSYFRSPVEPEDVQGDSRR